MSRALALVISSLCALLLNACALPTPLDSGVRPVGMSKRPPVESDEGSISGAMHSELIQSLLMQKQYYAALAHVEAAQSEEGATPELRYLEAEARRELGQSAQAQALYTGLLRSVYAAEAYQGLGLLQGARKDWSGAIEQLTLAVERKPASAAMRGDLGYALMAAGRWNEALTELATAVELDPGSARNRNNLIVLLMLNGDEAGVKRVASASDVSRQALVKLRVQAQSLRQSLRGSSRRKTG